MCSLLCTYTLLYTLNVLQIYLIRRGCLLRSIPRNIRIFSLFCNSDRKFGLGSVGGFTLSLMGVSYQHPNPNTHYTVWCSVGHSLLVHCVSSMVCIRVGVKYSTCTYLSVLDVLEYLVYRNIKVLVFVLVLVLVLDQKVIGT